VSVETRTDDGIPDINYIGGWIECKWLRSWPKRAETPVRLDHPLMAHQAAWLRRRRRRGGLAWVILQCRREWLLFDGVVAGKLLGTATKDELYQLCHKRWVGLNEEELIDVITNTKLPSLD